MVESNNKEAKTDATGAEEIAAPATESASAESAQPSMRQRLRERFNKEYPEDDYGTDEDGEILGGRIMDRLDQNDAQLKRYRENDERMKQMFVDNPATARFFTRWGAGDDPVNLFAEVFGDKLKETVNSDDAENLMKSGLQKYFDGIKKSEEANAEFANNAEASLELIRKREETSSPEEVDAIFEKVLNIAAEAASGKITEETIDMVSRALNHDKHVADAREEGLAAGRNERYQERLRSKGKGDGQPAAASGSSQMTNPDTRIGRPSQQGARSAWDAPETRDNW